MLSDEEVKLALEGKGKDHWVLIQDMGLMAAQGNQVPTISLFMPEAVLGIQVQSAKKQFTHYEPTEEDKRKSLMVVAHGYAGKTIADGCTSITRIVLLSDSSGGIVKEAYLTEPLSETWRNGFGATNECQALRAKFSLDDVQMVRQAAPNGEFLVAVFSGSVNTKMYKIKKKHQSKLTLE
jgi:poly(3-hydroxybutyrate) depolymerase